MQKNCLTNVRNVKYGNNEFLLLLKRSNFIFEIYKKTLLEMLSGGEEIKIKNYYNKLQEKENQETKKK